MLLTHCDHLLQTFGENPIVCEYHLAVLAYRRNMAQGVVMIGNYTQKLFVVNHTDASVLRRVTACSCSGTISAAVVDDRIIPVLVGLSQNALNTLRKILFIVVYGSNDAY
jgi:hypothetical protein